MKAIGQAGFTLIELVITVALVGILALTAMPVFEVSAKRNKEAELRAALRDLRNGIDAYHQAALAGKIEKKSDETGYPKRLEDLTQGVENKNDPSGKRFFFMRRLPRDPFADDPAQPAARTWGRRSYGNPPDAPVEGADVYDVYSLSAGIGLNGIPYRDW